MSTRDFVALPLTYRQMIAPSVRLAARRAVRGSRHVVLALMLCPACSMLVLEPLPKPRTVTLDLPADAIADGESFTRIVVHTDTTLAADKRSVALTTTAGTFLGDATKIIPDATGSAVVYLRAPSDSIIAIIRAIVNGSAASGELVFHRAQAERIDLVPEQFTLKAGLGTEIKIAATPRRLAGKPSPGTRVSFAATDTTAAHLPVGTFIPASAIVDAGGVVTARYTTADSTIRGPVLIRATSDNVATTIVLHVVAP